MFITKLLAWQSRRERNRCLWRFYIILQGVYRKQIRNYYTHKLMKRAWIDFIRNCAKWLRDFLCNAPYQLCFYLQFWFHLGFTVIILDLCVKFILTLKNLAAHRMKNRKSSLLYALSVSFIIFVSVGISIQMQTI